MKIDHSGYVAVNPLTDSEKKIISKIAGRIGTPVYVYFRNRIRGQIRHLKKLKITVSNFTGLKLRFHYAMLANHNPYIVQAVLDEMRNEKIEPGVLCASVGELELLQKIYPLPKGTTLVYADAALSDESLSTFGEFMSLGEVSQMYLILQSKSQMDEFAQWFRGLKYSEGMQKLRVGLRIKLNLDINEDIYSVYHGPNARFGIPIQEAIKCLMELGKLGINSVGLQIYPGTNILDMKRLLAIYTSFVLDVGKLLNKYPATDTIDSLFLDFGGGFGFDYTERRCVSIDQISRTLNKALRSLSDPKRKVIELLFEPGRVIVGPTGILTAKVVDVKVEKKQHFVVLDAGLSHFARPYIYGEQHQISLIGTKGRTKQRTFITGCTMASGDFFAGNPIRNQLINFPAVKKGDTVCILDGGAYGFCMASNFSGLLKPAEALIDNGNNKWWIIRERETTETLLAEVPLCLSSL